MPNEYANKIIIGGQTRIDLTGDTVTADKLMRGYTAHDRSGAPITGTHDDLTAEPLSVSANGTYTAPAGKAYSPVTVAVPSPETQTRTATPSLSTQSITPDSGKLLSAVTVNPITAQLLASLDADFVAGNIKKDVDLFGLIGTLEGGGTLSGVYFGTITPVEDAKTIDFSSISTTFDACLIMSKSSTSSPKYKICTITVSPETKKIYSNSIVYLPNPSSTSRSATRDSVTISNGVLTVTATNPIFTATMYFYMLWNSNNSPFLA